MSQVDEIYSEVEVLRGLLAALMVNWGQLKVRIEPAIAIVDRVLNNPTDNSIALFIEDMQDLDKYFRDIQVMSNDVYLNQSIDKTLELIGRLMGPEEKIVHGSLSYQ